MGIDKFPGEYIEEMTEPTGWPDIDEDSLTNRANDFLNLRNGVHGAAAFWQAQLNHIIDGGIWSGGAANAGNASMQQRISEMNSLSEHLGKSFAYYNLTAEIVAQTKNSINRNLQAAQTVIGDLRSSPDFSEATKEALIKMYVAWQNSINTAAVATAAGQVAAQAFAKWTPQAGAIPPLPLAAPSPTASPPTRFNFASQSGQAPRTVSPAQHSAPPPARYDLADQQRIGPAPAPPSSGSAQSPSGTGSGPGGGSSPGSPGGLGTPGSPSSPSSPSNPMSTSAPSSSGGPSSASSPSTSATSSPTSGGSPGTSPTTGAAAGQPATASPANAAKASQTSPFQSMANQAPPPLASSAPATSPAPSPAPSQPAAAAPSAGAGATSPGGAGMGGVSGGGSAGPAPVGGPSAGAPPASPPVPLGPPTTPPPPGPPPATPGAAASATGPGVAPMSTANTSAGAAPAPVPVSAARAERDAIASASTAGALRRKTNGNDPIQRARHVAAALNVGTMDFGFFWVTGVTTDGTIVVANSYGLGYIPEGVNLPDHVRMATADESIPAGERAKWATYPILAVQGWAQHHNHQLRAVVATEEQFANFDPGVVKIILTQEDIPEDGRMQGRSRLAVIAPAAAQQLCAVSDFGLNELLPPASADVEPPADETAKLWFDVAKPLMSTNPQRSTPHLAAFIKYAEHAQTLALHRAQTALEPDDQRRAIADWVYWQHLAVLMSDATSAEASV